MLLFPNRRQLPDNWIHVTRQADGSLQVRAELWYEVGRDGDWDFDARAVVGGPRRVTVSGITDGAGLFRAVTELLGSERLADHDVAASVEILRREAPEMLEAYLAAHRAHGGRLPWWADRPELGER